MFGKRSMHSNNLSIYLQKHFLQDHNKIRIIYLLIQAIHSSINSLNIFFRQTSFDIFLLIQ